MTSLPPKHPQLRGVSKRPGDTAGKGPGPQRLQPRGGAVGVFQLGKQKQTPLSDRRAQLSRGPGGPQGSPGAGMGGGVLSSSSPPQTAGGEGLAPHGAAASLGDGASPSLAGWGGHKPPLPKPLLRVSHPCHLLGSILPAAIPSSSIPIPLPPALHPTHLPSLPAPLLPSPQLQLPVCLLLQAFTV